MPISENGLRKIENYEGWKRLIKEGPNAGCYAAYQDVYHGKLDKLTIGPGLTEGVYMGLVLTRAECSARFAVELEKHAKAIDQLVKVPMTTNQREACISLSYNIGTGIGAKKGGFANSTVLKRLNKGDYAGAADAFKLFNRAGGGVVNGLVQRRASESAWFLKPDVAPEVPEMPQTVSESAPPVSTPTVAVGTTAAVVAVTQAAPVVIPPAVPQVVTDSLSNVSAWKGVGETIWTFKDWAIAQPTMAGALSIGVAGFWLWSKKQQGAK